jgi:hypothetical protein
MRDTGYGIQDARSSGTSYRYTIMLRFDQRSGGTFCATTSTRRFSQMQSVSSISSYQKAFRWTAVVYLVSRIPYPVSRICFIVNYSIKNALPSSISLIPVIFVKIHHQSNE